MSRFLSLALVVGLMVPTGQVPFLTEEQKRDIFYNNAARFLRLGKLGTN